MRSSSIPKRLIVVLAITAASVLLLTASRARAIDSENDGRIAFVGNQSGNFQLYSMNPDGSNVVQITNLAPTTFEIWLPDFSPDGRQLTFCWGPVDSSGNGPIEIYTINVDGTSMTQLTSDNNFDCAPRWSPDGTHITFIRASAQTGQGVVTTMRADGSDKRGLTTDCWGAFRSGYTHDGSRILFETQQAGFVSVLWIMNSDGTEQERLTQAPIKAGAPTVPSHGHVVFIDNQSTPAAVPNALFRMNLDGTDIIQLTQPVGDSHDVFPNYSPDGNHVVFASDRMSSDGSLDIFTMRADGSDIKRILTGVTVGGCADKNCVTPAWGRKP